MSVKDNNRAELVKAIVAQTKGRFFSVVAKRKKPKLLGYKHIDAHGTYAGLSDKQAIEYLNSSYGREFVVPVYDEFMEMTCRTGVKSKLAGGGSTIRHIDDLISVYVKQNGREGYRCFSAFNVLSIKAGGTRIEFNREDVLAYEE